MHKQSEILVYQLVRNGEMEIDQLGQVWRVRKRVADRWSGGTKVVPCLRVRAEIANKAGYLQVRAMIGGHRHYAAAHRLVWLHFKGLIPQGMTINHKDGQKPNNAPSNMELATYSQQRIHAIQHLGAQHWDCQGSKHPKTNLKESQVQQIRIRRAAGERIKDLAEEFGTTPKAASAICRRTNWKHC